MLKVKTTVSKSTIPGAGKGLFAAQLIPKGTVVWELDSSIDKIIAANSFDKMNSDDRVKFSLHAYQSKKTQQWIMCGDDAKFMNHSESPNLFTEYADDNTEDRDIAAYDIEPGVEILCNYFEFDEDADRKLST